MITTDKIELGTIVKVLRAPEKKEYSRHGWAMDWTREMDKFIGEPFRVTDAREDYGYILQQFPYSNKAVKPYWFPGFVLRPLSYDEIRTLSGIKAGDVVEIVSGDNGGTNGWNDWVESMYSYVGTGMSFQVDWENRCGVELSGTPWTFPHFSLKKVKKSKEEFWNP